MICAACDQPGHTIQHCPSIRDLLFTDVCVSCGDQLQCDAPVCAACQEWDVPVVIDLDFSPQPWAA